MPYPVIIQGGMGVGVSNWRLARAVSQLGQLGVVSGTVLDVVFARRLQQGDGEGHLRRALKQFPDQALASRVLDRYFIPGGKDPNATFKAVPVFTVDPPLELLELTVAANFAEVFLAKEGHSGVVGINFLEKIQMPILPSLYGALLAGVDYVLMGAGIPREIPGVLDILARHEPASLKLHVEGAPSEAAYWLKLDPGRVVARKLAPLRRPIFLAIIASSTLAIALARKATGRVDGFVIEGPTAGGHNAPPRGDAPLNERGEPVYGAKDVVNLEIIRELGRPYWLAGSYGNAQKVREALDKGAAGVQVGTAFAFCNESGIEESLKTLVLGMVRRGEVDVFTDPRASASGFPFKVVNVPGTLSEEEVFSARERLCDLGYLRHVYYREDGSLGYRCPAEPQALYEKKGGDLEDTVCRKCLCNGLTATIGLAQHRQDGYVEPPLITAGDDLKNLSRFLRPGRDAYPASRVIEELLAAVKQS